MMTSLPPIRGAHACRGVILAAIATLLGSAGGAVRAQPAQGLEIYGGGSFPGRMVGLGFPVAERVSMRVDVGRVSASGDTRWTEGIEYAQTLEGTRIGIFGDWFPFGGRFRVTGGMTLNDMNLAMAATGAGRVLAIGHGQYTLAPDDRFEVRARMPPAVAYLGIGWNHRISDTRWGFRADLGLSFGQSQLSARATGSLAQQPGIQDDIDREIQEIGRTNGSVRLLGRLRIGAGYRF